MDERLRELMEELGNAINESLSDSERIASAIGEIKRAGYDVFLVLEATIGFNKRSSEEELDAEEPGVEMDEERGPTPPSSPGRIRWTSQDEKFLRALKIAIEDD